MLSICQIMMLLNFVCCRCLKFEKIKTIVSRINIRVLHLGNYFISNSCFNLCCGETFCVFFMEIISTIHSIRLLPAIIVILLFYSVDGKIKCYVCDNYALIDKGQKSSDGCQDSDNIENLNNYEQECDSEEYNSCMKTVFDRYTSTPSAWGVFPKLVTIVARDCAHSVIGTGCIQKIGSNSRTLDCFCDTDLCNKSYRLHASYMKIIIFVFIVLSYLNIR